MEELLKAEHLSFAYRNNEEREEDEQTNVLDDVSLSVPKGQFLAVLGHNGSGKSTLAKHFNAILLPQGGVCYVKGIDTKEEDKLYDIRQTVGMVFQNPDNQIVATIVEEDVAFAPENLGLPPEEIRKRVDEALKDVNMYEYKDHAPHQLSGGQKQRVAIAGIIAMRPECIVLDEPTAMLDPRGRQEVLSTIRKLNREYGITVVLITHYMDEAAKADRVVVIDSGKLLMDGTPHAVFKQVDALKKVGLDVPQATELMKFLQEMGFDVDLECIDEKEAVEQISKLMEELHCQ